MSTPFDTRTAPAIIVATDNQIAFVAKLIAERDWNSASVATGHAKYVSRVAVLNIMIAWATNLMSDETPAEIARVVHTANGGLYPAKGFAVNAILAHCASDAAAGFEFCYAPLTRDGASKLIDWLKSLPVSAPEVTQRTKHTPLTDGIYVTDDGRTIKVQEARTGNGHLYAKIMDTDGSFRFVSGLVGQLASMFQHSKAHKMTLDEAAKYGALYGKCIECGRTLTDENSIAAGIGPICAQKF